MHESYKLLNDLLIISNLDVRKASNFGCYVCLVFFKKSHLDISFMILNILKFVQMQIRSLICNGLYYESEAWRLILDMKIIDMYTLYIYIH
jgi:hypothetical protein